MKICFKTRGIFDFNVLQVFSPYELVLAALFRKQIPNFPCLYSCICLCCHFGILKNNDFFPNDQNFLHRFLFARHGFCKCSC